MLILTAGNVTGPGQLEKDGLANYTVWIGINHHQIWAGPVGGHVRAAGASALLRRIADAMDSDQSESLKPSPVEEAVVRMIKSPACPKCGSQKLSCHQNGCTWDIG
jgi:hypothetical protein